MGIERSGYGFKVPELQADAVLSQASPVSGTKYTVLATTANLRLISVAVQCTWTVQPTPIEAHLTLDGNAYTHAFANPVSTTWYAATLKDYNPAASQDLASGSGLSYNIRSPYLFEVRIGKVEAEITGGTVSNLSSRVRYANW